MVDFLNNKNKEGISSLKSREESERIIREWFPKGPEGKEILERKELTKSEEEGREKFKEEIEKIELSQIKKRETVREAEKIKGQTVQRQISQLLYLAQTKGLTYAIKIAKETRDAYLIDLFHDILAKEGMFKKFSV
jgi:hypothetical protein